MQHDRQQTSLQWQQQPSVPGAPAGQPQLPIHLSQHTRQLHHASSSDEDDVSSLSASSNCSSGPGGSDDDTRRAQRIDLPGAFSTYAPGTAVPVGAENAAPTGKHDFLLAPSATRSEERHSRRVMRVYMKAIRLLTKMCMILEDDNVIVCKADAPAAKKLGKFMVRYDRLLGRLEALAARRGQLASATVPGGLLKALDDDVDPYEWIEDCAIAPHRRENEKARGLLYALGSYQASILHILRWEHLEAPLPPIHRLRLQQQQTEHQLAYQADQKRQQYTETLQQLLTHRPLETEQGNQAASLHPALQAQQPFQQQVALAPQAHQHQPQQ